MDRFRHFLFSPCHLLLGLYIGIASSRKYNSAMHRLSPPRTGTDFALGTGAGGSTSARGQDDKHISTVDADGVALAAIQALDKLSREKDKKIDQLTHGLDALRAQLDQLKRALAK